MLHRFTKLEVRLHLKSGEVLRYFATKVTTTFERDNSLSGIKNEGCRGWPLYLRLDDVSAITTHRVPFWKGLPR